MAVQLANLSLSGLESLTLAGLDAMTLGALALERLTLAGLDTLSLVEIEALPLPPTFTAAGRGGHRVAELAKVDHRLYRGIGASPDFVTPWDTWSALGLDGMQERQLDELSLDDLDTLRLDGLPYPHTTPQMLGISYVSLDDLDAMTLDELDDLQLGGHENRLVCRKRNEWGLESANRDETIITIADAGTEAATVPSSPTEIAIAAAAGGTFTVTAKYHYRPDGDDAATTWQVYFTSNGVDPDPATDVAVEVALVAVDGVARLSYTTAAFAAATTGKAVVRCDRSGVESVNTAVVSATAATAGPAAPSAAAHFGGLNTQG